MRGYIPVVLSTMVAFFSADLRGHDTWEGLVELKRDEQLQLEAFITGVHNLTALEGPFPPYICFYSYLWDDYYYAVEFGVRHYLTHVGRTKPKKEEPFVYIAWRMTLTELGCGDYDPLKEYHE